jgi:uncharacterized BrkB/YihY/UPF0761 family membrane protein
MSILKTILIIALIQVIIKLSIYLIDIEAFSVNRYGLYRYLLLVFLIFFSIYKLKETQRNRPFKQIFSFVFGTFLMTAFLCSVVDVLVITLFNNPDIIDFITDNEYKGYLDELGYMNATGDVDRDEIRDYVIENTSVFGLFKSFLIGIPFTIIISTLLSMLFYPSRSE